MKRATAGYIELQAFDKDGYRDDQASNITLQLIHDDDIGNPVALGTANPIPTGRNGLYRHAVTAAETDAYKIVPEPICATSGVQVIAKPAVIYTTEEEFSVDLTIKDSSGKIVKYCEVTITQRDDTVVVASGTSNSKGIVIPRLSQGDYDLYRNKSGYTFSDPQPFTVDSTGEAILT